MNNKKNYNNNNHNANRNVVLIATVLIIMLFAGIVMVRAQSTYARRGEEKAEMVDVAALERTNRIRLISNLVAGCVGLFLLRRFVPVFLKYKKDKEQEYDEKIVKRVIAELMPGAEFIRGECMDPHTLHDYGIVPLLDSYKKEGILRYQRDGQQHVFSNIHLLQKSEDSKGNISYKTVYKGQVYTARYKTTLSGAVRIFTTKMIPLLNKETIGLYPSKKTYENKIETENIFFNDNFEVYATDEQSAFFILDPIVMEQLLEMKKHYEQFGIYIRDGGIIIALDTNSITLPRRLYNREEEEQDFKIAMEEARKILRTAKLLEDTLNGSIRNNFTNQRRR